jgi:hypothetical protein
MFMHAARNWQKQTDCMLKQSQKKTSKKSIWGLEIPEDVTAGVTAKH